MDGHVVNTASEINKFVRVWDTSTTTILSDYSKYVSVVDTGNEKDVVSSKIKGSQVPSQIPNITGAGLNRLK